MKTLYLQCTMGAAGDMLTGALFELLPDQSAFLKTMNSLGLPGIKLIAEPAVKCGITGTHMKVLVHGEEEQPSSFSHTEDPGHSHFSEEAHDHHNHDHHEKMPHGENAHHHHTGIAEIREILSSLPLPEAVLRDAREVFDSIARAESEVHGTDMEHIHFHEVGTLDAVADVLGVSLAMYLLSPEKIIVSPVHVGSGTVQCAHGILPVPAPATALLLRGVPCYSTEVRGELCTPTGAALLRHFADGFGDMPIMSTEKIGYGMGKKDFDTANCVRAFWGDSGDDGDVVFELACNLDDMPPEDIGFARERLFDTGALDVWTTAADMKKDRPGTVLSCLCSAAVKDAAVKTMLKYTSTLGVREYSCRRRTLRREEHTMETVFGPVRFKRSSGYGIEREKPEYDDIARIARERGLSPEQIKKILTRDDPKDNQ